MKMFNMGSNGCALSRETLQEFEESFNTLMGSVKEKEMNIQRSIQCLLNNNSNKNAISNFDGYIIIQKTQTNAILIFSSKQASQCKNAANLKDNSVEISLSVSNDVECSVELNKFPEALNKDVMICERADDSLFIGNSAEKTVRLVWWRWRAVDHCFFPRVVQKILASKIIRCNLHPVKRLGHITQRT